MVHLLIFGLGYVGRAVAEAAAASGAAVTGTARGPVRPPPGAAVIGPAQIPDVLAGGVTHLLLTAPPGETGDPLLAVDGAAAALAAAPPRWVGYLSTTGVYGDRNGGWVDESTLPAPGSERARRRVEAEAAWSRFAGRCAVDLFRLAGIYGPERSAFDDLRAGRARRVIRPGHAFGRIHRDDIVRAVVAAMRRDSEAGVRVLNLADDEPAESAVVVEEAARLLGVPAPPAVDFATAAAAMSPMARGFWAENRKVRSRATQAALGIAWLYPSYREGLSAILAEERGEHPA